MLLKNKLIFKCQNALTYEVTIYLVFELSKKNHFLEIFF